MSKRNRLLAKQLAAAQRSNNPRTPEAKSRVRLTSLVQGLPAADLALPSEDPTAFDALRNSYLDFYDPQTPVEIYCVERLIDITWRHRRVPMYEAKLIGTTPDAPAPIQDLCRLARYAAALDKEFYTALKELEQRQLSRIGFARNSNVLEPPVQPKAAEPQPPEATPAAPKPPQPEPPRPRFSVAPNGKLTLIPPAPLPEDSAA